MEFAKHTKYVRVATLLSLVSASSYLWAQQGPGFGPPRGRPGGFGGGPGDGPNGGFGGPGGRPGGFPGRGPDGGFPGEEFEEEETGPLPESKVTIEVRDGFRYISSNGIANHPTGKFPHPGNPGRISAQDWKFRMPLRPTVGEATPVRHGNVGVAVNGVPFNPATNEFWNNNRAWNYDALSGKIWLGTDSSNAHVQPGGIYHYHGLPHGLIAKIAKKDQMTLIGYAADGFPMYATYGHTTANNAQSTLKKLRSSYRLKEGTRPGGNEGPGGVYDGTFSADWEYVEGAGDLDDCNGRTGVTPEYPQGTYYYVVTDQYPFLPRYFRGTPDASFNGPRPQGGPGGPGGLGGQGRSGAGPGGGFGGPNGQGHPGQGHPGRASRLDGPSIEELSELLNLTPQQRTRIKSILDARQKEIEAVLSPAQRTALQRNREQNGPPGDGTFGRFGEREPGGQGFGGPEPDEARAGGGMERMIAQAAKELGVTTTRFRSAFQKMPRPDMGPPTLAQRQAFAQELGVPLERLDAVMEKYRPGGRRDQDNGRG